MPITVTPLDAALGAEVSGLDVRDIPPADAKALRDAFLEHHVLVVHGPAIGDDDLVRFGECFGPLEMARNPSPLSSRPEVWVVSNIRMDGKLVGALPDGEMSFHFDRIHQKQPNLAGVLHAIEIPRAGGDTWFANMCRAYETLPDATRQRLDGLTARHVYEYGSVTTGGPVSADAPRADPPMAVSPARPAKNERRKLMGRLRFRSSFAPRVCAMRDKISRSTPAILAPG